jgi:hypothetical protein
MNSKLLTLIFTLFALSTQAVQHRADSSVVQYYSSGTSTWINQYKYVSGWDGQCKNQLRYVTLNWNPSAAHWDSTYEYAYSYDAQDRKTMTIQRQGSGTLAPSSQTLYNYAGNNLSSYTLRYWLPYLNNYRDQYKYVYHYVGSSSKYDSVFTQRWDTASNSWLPYSRYIYYSDAAGDDTMYLYQGYNTGTMGYDNSLRYHYSYTSTHKTAQYYTETWDAGSSAYVPSVRYTYTYRGDDQIADFVGETWNTGSNTWVNSYKTVYSYNANADCDSTAFYTWLTASGSWSYASRYYYYYGCAISTGIEEATADQVQLFPNPAMGSIQLSLPSLTAPTTISIMNMQGQQLSQQPVTRGMNTISISDLAPGMYLLQWLDGAQLRTKPFIKE